MRKALTITVLAGAMTFGFGTAANAITVYTPGASASCVSATPGSTTVTPGGGVSQTGANVSVAPLGTCI